MPSEEATEMSPRWSPALLLYSTGFQIEYDKAYIRSRAGLSRCRQLGALASLAAKEEFNSDIQKKQTGKKEIKDRDQRQDRALAGYRIHAHLRIAAALTRDYPKYLVRAPAY